MVLMELPWEQCVILYGNSACDEIYLFLPEVDRIHMFNIENSFLFTISDPNSNESSSEKNAVP